MRRVLMTAAALAAVCVIGLQAQQTADVPSKGPNPHVKSQWAIDGAAIAITYGRPSLKGRALSSFDWWGREWRTGADERTKLETNRTLRFGSLDVPAGAYGLYARTGEGNWDLIFTKAADGWGAQYPQGQDLGRAPMRAGTAPQATELVTFSIDDTPAGGTLHLDWGTSRQSIDFTVGQ